MSSAASDVSDSPLLSSLAPILSALINTTVAACSSELNKRHHTSLEFCQFWSTLPGNYLEFIRSVDELWVFSAFIDFENVCFEKKFSKREWFFEQRDLEHDIECFKDCGRCTAEEFRSQHLDWDDGDYFQDLCTVV